MKTWSVCQATSPFRGAIPRLGLTERRVIDPMSVGRWGCRVADEADLNEWEAVAEAWEANRERVFDFFRTASEWLVEAIDPKPGQIVLDVAAGPGETGFLVADAVGPEGSVISSDLAPTMVDAARRGASSRGLTNVDCRVMDAEALDLDDDSVDAAISRLGLMLVPDPAAAFRELRRVVRSAGTVAYTVIGAPDQNQWMALMMGALMQHGHQPATGNPFETGRPVRPLVSRRQRRAVAATRVSATSKSSGSRVPWASSTPTTTGKPSPVWRVRSRRPSSS